MISMGHKLNQSEFSALLQQSFKKIFKVYKTYTSLTLFELPVTRVLMSILLKRDRTLLTLKKTKPS